MDASSFGKEVISKDIADQILNLASQVDKASVFDANTQRPNEVIVVDIDLSVARLETDPKIIKFPFKSVYVVQASDTAALINLKPISRDSSQGSIPFRDKDSWKLDRQITDCYIHWDAQAGKTMKLIFFVNSSFESGSFVTVIQGGVAVIEGNSSEMERVSGDEVEFQICALNLNRKILRFKNISDWPVRVSTVTPVDANNSWAVPSGATFEWRNTEPLYGKSVGLPGVNTVPMYETWEQE